MGHVQDTALKEAMWLLCHSLHPPAWNSELACGPGEDKGHILGMVEQKDDIGATNQEQNKLFLFVQATVFWGLSYVSAH